MKFLYKLFSALVVLATFVYLAYTMYFFDDLSGRQFFLVILIASFMIGIFGKTVAAIISLVIGLLAAIFVLWSKDEDESEKIIPTKKL
ncbi:hypothetical protein [Paenimyroides aestuarii]|uniref:DUF1049 domain-containing protein n=1 Tax=Paenimyroides aestuarii TaxID=2968490 RepID=A0ABY5NQS0_9FLAO|nr:hypothetical protein [Paenimyroides aestuarii]UUV20870.1 hypothetical protein NPX36_11145 [Paenimyroides aestuarii]